MRKIKSMLTHRRLPERNHDPDHGRVLLPESNSVEDKYEQTNTTSASAADDMHELD